MIENLPFLYNNVNVDLLKNKPFSTFESSTDFSLGLERCKLRRRKI